MSLCKKREKKQQNKFVKETKKEESVCERK